MAGDLVLITTDPTSGQSLLGSTETDPVLGGAREVEGAPKWARLRVVSTVPIGTPAHDRARAKDIARGGWPGAAASAAVTAASVAVRAAVISAVTSAVVAASAGGAASS